MVVAKHFSSMLLGKNSLELDHLVTNPSTLILLVQ